jgi:hypothetical protein
VREQFPLSDPDGARKTLGIRAGVAPEEDAAVAASRTDASALAASSMADSDFEEWRRMVSSVGSLSGDQCERPGHVVAPMARRAAG